MNLLFCDYAWCFARMLLKYIESRDTLCTSRTICWRIPTRTFL